MTDSLGERELRSISEYSADKGMSLAVLRVREAPSELMNMFEEIASACGMSFKRNLGSPSSEFGFAELYSNDRILVVLHIGGPRTELVSLSEIDDVFLQDLEDAICSSNIQSSTIRDGL